MKAITSLICVILLLKPMFLHCHLFSDSEKHQDTYNLIKKYIKLYKEEKNHDKGKKYYSELKNQIRLLLTDNFYLQQVVDDESDLKQNDENDYWTDAEIMIKTMEDLAIPFWLHCVPELNLRQKWLVTLKFRLNPFSIRILNLLEKEKEIGGIEGFAKSMTIMKKFQNTIEETRKSNVKCLKIAAKIISNEDVSSEGMTQNIIENKEEGCLIIKNIAVDVPRAHIVEFLKSISIVGKEKNSDECVIFLQGDDIFRPESPKIAIILVSKLSKYYKILKQSPIHENIEAYPAEDGSPGRLFITNSDLYPELDL